MTGRHDGGIKGESACLRPDLIWASRPGSITTGYEEINDYYWQEKKEDEMKSGDWGSDVCSSDLVPTEIKPKLPR